MSLSKKIHTNENEGMEESDEDLSGDEESDNGEGVSAGNEVIKNFEAFFTFASSSDFIFAGNSS